MNPYYRRARFLKSAATPDQAPPDRGAEVAFAGRSNAGKSSALNALCDQKALARTSKTPGRTQLLNFFALDEDRRLVDLPGYGFARVSEAVKRRWQDAMADYLAGRRSLRGLVLVMDLRHPLKDYDRHMLEWAGSADLPVHILLTKADKLSRGPASAALQGVRRDLRTAGHDHAGVQLFSALRRQGLDQAHGVLDAWLGLGPGDDAGQKKDPGS